VRAKIDPENGDLRVWVQELERIEHEDEEGEITVETKVLTEQEVPVTDEFKGRIGAQTAKQVIFQKLRDAEREMTYEEFAGREGDVVTGIVQQSERRYTLLDLGKVRRCCRRPSRCPASRTATASGSRATSPRSARAARVPQIVVSRTHPGSSRSCSSSRFPRSPRGSSRSGRSPASPGIVRRSRSRPTSRRSTRWARASARRARASATW
jgi:N utilization substance protein A